MTDLPRCDNLDQPRFSNCTMASESKTASEKLSFEEAISRLEEIIGNMENNSQSLDEMVKSFEEGQRLVRLCNERLAKIERKVNELTGKADGSTGQSQFEESPGR